MDEIVRVSGPNPSPNQIDAIQRICKCLGEVGSKKPIPEAIPSLIAIAISRHPNSSDARKAIIRSMARAVDNIDLILSDCEVRTVRRLGEDSVNEVTLLLKALAGNRSTPLVKMIDQKLARDVQFRRSLGEGLIETPSMRLERPLRRRERICLPKIAQPPKRRHVYSGIFAPG